MRMTCIFPLAFLLGTCGDRHKAKPDFLAANIDTTVNPADDFFQYENGRWLEKNAIPAGESNRGYR